MPEETCFQQAGSSAVEGTTQAILGSSDQQRKLPASLSLFLKSEKIPSLLYLGKGPEYRPFRDLRSVPEAARPREQVENHRPRAQISNHGRACTRVLLLYIFTWALTLSFMS
jgi:hypothetical protein